MWHHLVLTVEGMFTLRIIEKANKAELSHMMITGSRGGAGQ